MPITGTVSQRRLLRIILRPTLIRWWRSVGAWRDWHRGSINGISALAAAFRRSPRQDPVHILSSYARTLFPEIIASASPTDRFSDLVDLDRDHKALANLIFGNELARLAAETPLETMAYLVSAVDRDFRDGRLVVIKGWTLSQTEARLLALVEFAG
jgi:hypothetical protein